MRNNNSSVGLVLVVVLLCVFQNVLDWVDCFLFDCFFVSLCFLSHFILYFILKKWLRVGLCFHNASARRNALDL
jgi:hypothetical protein